MYYISRFLSNIINVLPHLWATLAIPSEPKDVQPGVNHHNASIG